VRNGGLRSGELRNGELRNGELRNGELQFHAEPRRHREGRSGNSAPRTHHCQPQNVSFWSCGWKGAVRRCDQLDPESRSPPAPRLRVKPAVGRAVALQLERQLQLQLQLQFSAPPASPRDTAVALAVVEDATLPAILGADNRKSRQKSRFVGQCVSDRRSELRPRPAAFRRPTRGCSPHRA
jgi:hypothetical protein